MDPLNKQERTEAFIKMLAFFLFAVIIVAIPMYYAFKLPEKENSFKRSEFDNLSSRLEELNNFEQEFLIKTDSALSLFNAFKNEQEELSRDKIQLRFSDITNQMEDYIEEMRNDSTKVRLYDNIIYSYNNLFSTWAEKNDFQAQLEECLKTTSGQSAVITREKEMTIEEREIDLIKRALEKHNGNKRLAAREIGSTERKLRKRMEELGIN